MNANCNCWRTNRLLFDHVHFVNSFKYVHVSWWALNRMTVDNLIALSNRLMQQRHSKTRQFVDGTAHIFLIRTSFRPNSPQKPIGFNIFNSKHEIPQVHGHFQKQNRGKYSHNRHKQISADGTDVRVIATIIINILCCFFSLFRLCVNSDE